MRVWSAFLAAPEIGRVRVATTMSESKAPSHRSPFHPHKYPFDWLAVNAGSKLEVGEEEGVYPTKRKAKETSSIYSFVSPSQFMVRVLLCLRACPFVVVQARSSGSTRGKCAANNRKNKRSKKLQVPREEAPRPVVRGPPETGETRTLHVQAAGGRMQDAVPTSLPSLEQADRHGTHTHTHTPPWVQPDTPPRVAACQRVDRQGRAKVSV